MWSVHGHILMSSSYKCVTWQIYAQENAFSSFSLKIRVKRPIMNLDGRYIICVGVWVFAIVNFLVSYAYTMQRKLKILITRLKTELS